MPAIEISSAAPADADEIVRMVAALSRQEGDPDDLFDRTHVMADMFGEAPWLNGQIARVDGAIGGVALWHRAYETSQAARGGFVTSLWVDPPFRRLGVATRLIAAVAANAADHGATFLWWASKPLNARAHATYASLGAGAEEVVAHALVRDRFNAMVANAKTGRRT